MGANFSICLCGCPGVPGWRCALRQPILSPDVGLGPSSSCPMYPGRGEPLKVPESACLLPTSIQSWEAPLPHTGTAPPLQVAEIWVPLTTVDPKG